MLPGLLKTWLNENSTLRKLFRKSCNKIFEMRKILRYVRKHKVVRCADEYRQNVAVSEVE
jgi:hypothetical protein